MNTWAAPITIAFDVSWLASVGMNFVATESLKENDKNEFEVPGEREDYFFLYVHPVWRLYLSYVYVLLGRYKKRDISREAKSAIDIARVVSITNVSLGLSLLYVVKKRERRITSACSRTKCPLSVHLAADAWRCVTE